MISSNTEIPRFVHQLHLMFVSAFRGKIADVFKSCRYKNYVARYSVVAIYNFYRYTNEKSIQIIDTKTIRENCTTNILSQFNKYLDKCILVST